jgi:hypothetical protein
MSRETEKMMKIIKQLIEEKGLTSEEEINAFLKNEIINKSFEDLDFDLESSEEEIALDIIERARLEEDVFESISLIEEALSYDKKCIDAYVLLASKQTHPFLVEYFFKKALNIGKKRFPKEFLEENKDHLWAVHEVRPYLMAINGLAQLNYQEGDFWSCSKKLERLIKLCPNDNMGVRELLFTVLLDLEKFKKFKRYSEMFLEDSLASTMFSRVFYSFFNDNDLEKTVYLLKIAQKSNQHITKKLITPNIKFKLNDSYALGSPEEANNYCYFAKELWQDKSELIHWLKQNQ